MIYINFTREISDRRSYSSRTDAFRTMFESARQRAIAEGQEVSLVGYCYKHDLDFIMRHVSNFVPDSIFNGKKYFCRFIVTKDTKIL